MQTFNDLLVGGPRFDLRTVARFKGGGSTTSTSYTSQLPEYAEPYYTELMARSEAVSQEPYQPYGQPRISDFDQDQQAAFMGTRDLYQYGSPAMDAAQGYTDFGLMGAAGAMGNPDLYGGVFNDQARDYYMSPYMDSVTERLKQSAIEDAQEQQKYRDSQAVQAGAFGGDRRFVMDSIADRSLMSQLSDIEAEQTQQAFENAQMQFERDRQRGLQADMFNQQYDLDAANTLFTGGQMLGDLSATGQDMEMARIQALYDQGEIQQGQEQRSLDAAYEDFINQRDYPRNALTWLSGIMHGVPVSAESNVVQYAPSGNPMSQALGSGIAGLSMYNAFQ